MLAATVKTVNYAMQHARPLIEAEFLKRYKRFFADVRLPGGEVVVAHVANTGSLKGCLEPGGRCLISSVDDPKRKLKHTLHFLSSGEHWIGVNTALPNALVFDAWAKRLVPSWREYGFGRREFKISAESRLDMVLATTFEHFERREGLHHVEIKNVTYAEGPTALFPDAKTERGQKHLRDLIALKKAGHGAELVFVVQRGDCTGFAPADQIDPVYGQLLREARAVGVSLTAMKCLIDPLSGVSLIPGPLPLKF